jgi:hypothetical protein
MNEKEVLAKAREIIALLKGVTVWEADSILITVSAQLKQAAVIGELPTT